VLVLVVMVAVVEDDGSEGVDISVEKVDVDGSEIDVDVDINGSSDTARPDDDAAACPSGSCGCGREPERVSQEGYKLSRILPPRHLDAPGIGLDGLVGGLVRDTMADANVLFLVPFHSAPSPLYPFPRRLSVFFDSYQHHHFFAMKDPQHPMTRPYHLELLPRHYAPPHL